MNSRPDTILRKWLPALTFAAIVISLILFIYSFLARPRISVTAPLGSTITVTTLQTNQQVASQQAAADKTTIQVDPGDYTIVIQSGEAKKLFSLSLALFETRQLSGGDVQQLSSTFIARTAAHTVLPGKDSIYYLDPVKRSLVAFDSNGHKALLGDPSYGGDSPGVSFAGTARPTHSIADNQAITQINSILYVMRNGQLSHLNTEGFPEKILSPPIIGTNSQQKSFVAVINKTLFRYDTPDAKPEKILDLDKKIDQLALGGNRVIAFSTSLPAAAQNLKPAYGSYAIDPIVVDIEAKTQKTLLSGPVTDVSLAPDGNHATIQYRDRKYLSLYDIPGSKELYNTDSPNLTTPLWLDANRYVYGKGASVWQYNIADRSAATIATLADNQQPTSITYDASNQSYYATTYNSAASAAIYHLSNAEQNDNINKAASATLHNDPDYHYTYNFINITKPIITITTDPLQSRLTGDALKAATLSIRDKAIKQLTDSGVDISKLTIIFNPADPL